MKAIRHVLLSNDDGIDAPGLQELEETLRSLPGFRVTVVAPSDQQSASSHSLSVGVLVALEKILREDKPDVVLSGINHGPNMGEDVIYSGTVAAAMEGTMFGVPSYAISTGGWHPQDFTGPCAFLRHNLTALLAFPLRKGSLLNINIPDGPPEAIRGIRVTRLGSRVYQNVITDQVDPHGRPYFWIGGKGPTWEQENGTDYSAVQAGYVSVTPLMVDLTHYGMHQEMKHLECDGLEPGAAQAHD